MHNDKYPIMRAHEFINPLNEGKTGKLDTPTADALPATYVIPELPNQDPYLQYRFGVAIANSKGADARAQERGMDATSAWGENQIVVSYGEDAGPMIDAALKIMGKRGKRMISTSQSEEDKAIDNVRSPVKGFSGYTKKSKR